jgi:L-ribulose-5-phosphate 4-epimerase
VWGADVEQAVENAIALEAVARLARDTVALRPDAPEIDAALLTRHFRRKHGPGAYYGQR